MPILKNPYWVRSHALRILPAISSPDRISVISGTRCSASQMSKNCFIPSQKKPCSMRLIVSLAMPVRSATSFCVKPNSIRLFFKKPAIFKRASFNIFSCKSLNFNSKKMAKYFDCHKLIKCLFLKLN